MGMGLSLAALDTRCGIDGIWDCYGLRLERLLQLARSGRHRRMPDFLVLLRKPISSVASLLGRLIEAAVEHQYHLMVRGIDVTNSASISLHETLGFVHAGTTPPKTAEIPTAWSNLGQQYLAQSLGLQPCNIVPAIEGKGRPLRRVAQSLIKVKERTSFPSQCTDEGLARHFTPTSAEID